MTDIILEILELLHNEWDSNNLTYTGNVRKHTGWYDYQNPVPQVTVTNKSETTLRGGETGISAGTGTGGKVQIRGGTVLVNGWSGTREKLRGKGPDDSDINPKQMAFELGKEIERIFLHNELDDYNSLAPSSLDSMVDPEAPEAVFREECTVTYTYVRSET